MGLLNSVGVMSYLGGSDHNEIEFQVVLRWGKHDVSRIQMLDCNKVGFYPTQGVNRHCVMGRSTEG